MVSSLGQATVGGGPLRELWAFDKRIEVDDGAGNKQGDWQQQFQAAARMESIKGGEAVMAARLERKQPYVVTIRYSISASAVTPDWRARDVRTGLVYAITAVDARPRNDYIDMLVTLGPAA